MFAFFATITHPKDLQPLTPGHFLIGRPVASLPDPNVCHIPVSRLTSFQRLQYLHQNLWKRWSQEYISELQQRLKWRTQQSQLEPDMLVLVKDDNVPPLQWKLGRICQLHPDTDGIARVASVRTQHVLIRRAFSKLCPLVSAVMCESA
ncbi:methyltransferase (DUF5641) [Popillia japonica]|uniref:Methyltransferase (DUF5641) n=1 Tax=Popillia japonica TaxID=7064 RepID=A0AAW1MZ03_POPJA